MSENQEVKKTSIVQIDKKTGDIVDVPENLKYSPDALSIGVVVPMKNRTSVDYLQNSRDYKIDNYGTDNVKRIFNLCKIMYLTEGIIGTAIDLFVDYSLTEIEIDNLANDSKEKTVLEWWIRELNKDNDNMHKGINGLVSEMMLDYWTYGNIFSYKKTTNVLSSEIDSKKMRGKSISMPLDIYLLDPMFIEIPNYITIAGGGKQIYLKLEEDFIVQLNNDKSLQEKILKGFTPAERALIIKNKQLPLDMTRLKHIKRKSRGYDEWGVPYLTRCFNAIARKKKIQALDEATIDGLINQVTIFKIGLGPKEDPQRTTWDPRRLQGLSSLLSQPNPSNWIVWTNDISTETVSPNENILGLDKKYIQVDKEILKSLGIPTVLLSGEGSTADNTENVWVAISSLLEKIESARSQIKTYIEDLMMEILKDNDLDTTNKPILRWRKPNLRNEKEFTDFVLALYDRGVLPIETLVKEAGQKWSEILRGRLAESKDKIDGKTYDEIFMRRDLPFGTPTDPNAQKPGNNKAQPQGKNPTNKPSTQKKPTKVAKPTTVKKSKGSFDGEDEVRSFIEDQNRQFIDTYENDNSNIDIKLATSFHFLTGMIKTLSAQNESYVSIANDFTSIRKEYFSLFCASDSIEIADLKEKSAVLSQKIIDIFSRLQNIDPEEGVVDE